MRRMAHYRGRKGAVATVVMVAVVVLLLLAWMFLFKVDFTEHVIVRTFGKTTSVLDGADDAGLHMRWPFVQEIVRYDARTFDFAPALSAAHTQADGMFARAAGNSARLVAEAGSEKVRLEMAERTRAERFQRELDAWKASPNMYVLDRRLDVWDEVLVEMVKKGGLVYVIGVDPGKIEVWMNWEQESRGMEGAFQGAEGGNK